MPTFDTPEPIAVTLDVGVGDIQVVASDRTDTVVDVRPSDPAKKADVTAAEQTRVEYASGRLSVRAQKGWRWSFRAGRESVDVQIELPTGSQVSGEAGVAALHCTGRIGGCHFKTGVGDIQLDQAGPLELKAGAGDITVGQSSAMPRSRRPEPWGSAASTGRRWSRTPTATHGSATSRATCG